MKTYISFISLSSLLLLGCSNKTLVLAPEAARSMEKIIEIEGKDKESLYVLANSWAVETFTSADAVIEYQDKEVGRIMGKYSFEYSPENSLKRYLFRQTIIIDTKDGKVKCKITDPYKKMTYPLDDKAPYTSYQYSPLVSEHSVAQARIEWSEIMKSLEAYLKDESIW